jgi:hypothetical protein
MLEWANRERLWKAINEYVKVCGGEPTYSIESALRIENAVVLEIRHHVQRSERQMNRVQDEITDEILSQADLARELEG